MATAKRTGGVTLGDFVAQVITAPGFGECLRLCSATELDDVCERIPEAFYAARFGRGEECGLHKSLMDCVHGPVFRYVEELEIWQAKERERVRKQREKWRDEGCRERLRKLQLGQQHQVCGPWLEGDHDNEECIKQEMQRPVYVGSIKREELEPSLEFLEHIEDAADRIEFGPWSEADALACTDRLRNAWYKWIACLSAFWMREEVPVALARSMLARHNGRQPAKDGKPGRPAKLDKDAILKAYDDLYSTKGTAAAGIVAARFTCDAQTVRKYVRQRDNKKNEPNPAG